MSFRMFRPAIKSNPSRRSGGRRLAFEGLERLELLAPLGTASLQTNGTLLIEGTQAADTVYVSTDLVMFGQGNVCVQFGNSQGISFSKKFPIGQVKEIRFNGYSGWDDFHNNTWIDCVAYGGAGWDNLRGGSGNDKLYGEGDVDKIWGGDGSDLIDGGGGDDFLYGEGATDYMGGGPGSDLMNGGNDTDYMSGGSESDIMYGGAGEDFLFGEHGDDYLWGDKNMPNDAYATDFLFGGIGSDTLDGDNGDDFLDGGADGDTLKGGAGNDWLYGGTGADKLYGESGWDVLYGGEDNAKDILNGGADPDLFIRSYGSLSSWPELETIQDEIKGVDVVFDGNKSLIDPWFWWAGTY